MSTGTTGGGRQQPNAPQAKAAAARLPQPPAGGRAGGRDSQCLADRPSESASCCRCLFLLMAAASPLPWQRGRRGAGQAAPLGDAGGAHAGKTKPNFYHTFEKKGSWSSENN